MGDQTVLRCDWRLLWFVITDVIGKGLFHAGIDEPVPLPPPMWRYSKLLWFRVHHCDILLWSVLTFLSVLGGCIFTQSAIHMAAFVLCCQGALLFAWHRLEQHIPAALHHYLHQHQPLRSILQHREVLHTVSGHYDKLIGFVDMLASPARCKYSTIVALWGYQLPYLLYILVLVLCRFVQHLIASVIFNGGLLILGIMKMFDWLVCTMQPVLRMLYWCYAVPAILILLVFTFPSPPAHHKSGLLHADPNHKHPPPDTLSSTLWENNVHPNLPWHAPAPLFMAEVFTGNETRDCNTYTRTRSAVPPETPRKNWPWYDCCTCVAFCVRALECGVCFHFCAAALS